MNWLVESAVSELDRQDNGPMYLGERRLLRAIFDRPILESFGDEEGDGDLPEMRDRRDSDPVAAATDEINKGKPVVATGSGTDLAIKALRKASEDDPQLKACAAIIVSQAKRATKTFPHEKRDEMMADLISAGKTAVFKFKDQFDPSKGVAFTTFMFPYISGEIKHAMAKIYKNLKTETLETDMKPNSEGDSVGEDEENIGFDMLTAQNSTGNGIDDMSLHSEFSRPDEVLDREDTHAEVKELFRRVNLSPAEMDALQSWMANVRGVDAAAARGVSPQAINNLTQRAVLKIKRYLAKHPQFRDALDALPR